MTLTPLQGSRPVVGRAGVEDLADVSRLTLAAYVGAYLPDDDPYAAHLADAAGRARDAEVLVARLGDGGAAVGTVTYCPLGSPMREIARDDEAEFRMLAVDPVARGRGVGRALVEECLRLARAADLGGVRLSTMAPMTGARRLYERLGFTRAPDDDWSPTPGVQLLAYALRW